MQCVDVGVYVKFRWRCDDESRTFHRLIMAQVCSHVAHVYDNEMRSVEKCLQLSRHTICRFGDDDFTSFTHIRHIMEIVSGSRQPQNITHEESQL